VPYSSPAHELKPTSVATAVVFSPFADYIGLDLVEQFRITTHEIWHEGNGSIREYMLTESDAMVLTRIAMGEAPSCIDDRIMVMWNIRLRAELGFKNAGAYGGWRAEPDRWGPPTSIKREGVSGQYAPVTATNNVYFPLIVNSHIRAMISPTDKQLGAFYLTYIVALKIVDAPMSDYPEQLKGFDSFRAPSIAWHGQRNRPGGLKSIQLFSRGEIWRDEYPQDNVFWELLKEALENSENRYLGNGRQEIYQ